MLCSTLLPYQNALTNPLLRCPFTLYPSAFDHPSPPSPATHQASRAHDKRDLYNTCIVSQLSRNKYCLNQVEDSPPHVQCHISETPLYLMDMNKPYEQEHHWLCSFEKQHLTETQIVKTYGDRTFSRVGLSKALEQVIIVNPPLGQFTEI